MPSVEISNSGDKTERIISLSEANRVKDPKDPTTAYTINPEDGDIRIASEIQESDIPNGLQILEDMYYEGFVPLDGRGKAIEFYAYNDEASGSVNVTVSPQHHQTLADGGLTR